MLKLGTDLKTWMDLTNLEINIYECPHCGEQYPTVIPVIFQNSVGLISEVHGCGDSYYGIVTKPWAKAEYQFLAHMHKIEGYELH